jgi:hypothetical protein
MSRFLSAEMQAIAASDVVRPIFLVDLVFDTNPVYLWNGIGDLSYNSQTYIGAGDLLNIGQLSENAELAANGITVSLAGANQQLLQKARDEDYQGRELILRLGAFDDNGDLVSSPVILFSGFMDVMKVDDSGDAASIGVSAENKLIAFERTKIRRYTNEDQKIDYPNDKGFEFISKIQEMDIIWGRAGGNMASYSGGGGGRGNSRGREWPDDQR